MAKPNHTRAQQSSPDGTDSVDDPGYITVDESPSDRSVDYLDGGYLTTTASEDNTEHEEVAKLEARIGELSRELEQLRDEKAKLSRDLKDAQATLKVSDDYILEDAQLKARVAELEKALSVTKRALDSAMEIAKAEVLEQYLGSVAELEVKHREISEKSERLQRENLELRQKVLEIETEHTKAFDLSQQEHTEKLAAQVSAFSEERRQMQEAEERLRQESAQVLENSSQLVLKIQALSEEKEAVEYKLEKLKERFQELESQKPQPTKETTFSALVDQQHDLRKREATLNAREAEFQKLLKILQEKGLVSNQVEMWGKDGKLNDNLLKELKPKVKDQEDELRRQLIEKERLLTESNKKNEFLQIELDNLSLKLSELENAKARLFTMEATLADLTSKLESEKEAHKAQVAALQAGNESLQQKLIEAEARESQLSASLDSLRQTDVKKKQLEEELQQLRAEKASIYSELSATKASIAETQAEVEGKAQELERAQIELTELREENQRLKDEGQDLTQKLSRANAERDAAFAAKEDAERKMQEMQDQIQAMSLAHTHFQQQIATESAEKEALREQLRAMEEDLREQAKANEDKQEHEMLLEMAGAENAVLEAQLAEIRARLAEVTREKEELGDQFGAYIVSKTRSAAKERNVALDDSAAETDVDDLPSVVTPVVTPQPVTPPAKPVSKPVVPLGTPPVEIDVDDGVGDEPAIIPAPVEIDEAIGMNIDSAIESATRDIYKEAYGKDKFVSKADPEVEKAIANGQKHAVANALVSACAKYSLMKKYVTEQGRSLDDVIKLLAPPLEQTDFHIIKTDASHPKPDLILNLAERNAIVAFVHHNKNIVAPDISRAFMANKNVNEDVQAHLKNAFGAIDLKEIKDWALASPLISKTQRIRSSEREKENAPPAPGAAAEPSTAVHQPISFSRLSPHERVQQISVS